MLPRLYDFTVLGAVFERVVDVGFGREGDLGVRDGRVVMGAGSYFYSGKTSPYVHVCCFEVKEDGRNYYVFVRLRD